MLAVVVPGRKDALPQAFDVKGACADGELLTEVFDEADLGVQIGGIPRGSLAQSYDAFVGDELDKEPVSPPAIGLDVFDYDGFHVGDFHGWYAPGVFYRYINPKVMLSEIEGERRGHYFDEHLFQHADYQASVHA